MLSSAPENRGPTNANASEPKSFSTFSRCASSCSSTILPEGVMGSKLMFGDTNCGNSESQPSRQFFSKDGQCSMSARVALPKDDVSVLRLTKTGSQSHGPA